MRASPLAPVAAPDFQAKAERVPGLYRERPLDGVVVCFDEMGPIQLIPHPGSGWAQQSRPERLRATYSQHGWVRSAHKTPDIRHWAQDSNVELVFTPTYASFLNRIECHFWAIGEFVVNNADYPDWDACKKAMADHIHYRNGPHRDQRLLKAERRLLIAA